MAAPHTAAPAPVAAAPAAKIDGEKIYKSTCFACHDVGVANAPKLGDKTAWASRIATGQDALYQCTERQKRHASKGRNAALADDGRKRRWTTSLTKLNKTYVYSASGKARNCAFLVFSKWNPVNGNYIMNTHQPKASTYQWRDLFQQILRHRKALLLANGVAILAALVSVPTPLLIPLLVDEVLLHKPAHMTAFMNDFPNQWHRQCCTLSR